MIIDILVLLLSLVAWLYLGNFVVLQWDAYWISQGDITTTMMSRLNRICGCLIWPALLFEMHLHTKTNHDNPQ